MGIYIQALSVMITFVLLQQTEYVVLDDTKKSQSQDLRLSGSQYR